MSKISEHAAAVAAQLDRLEAGVQNVQGDVSWLKSEIQRLTDSLGDISPEDQAILDGITSRLSALGDSVSALAESTPDQPPPEE